MNANHDNPGPDSLRSVLREWRVENPLPPRFTEGVWRRIEQEGALAQSPWTAVGRWLAAWLSQPAWAAGVVGVFLGVGLAVGYLQAQGHLKATFAQERSLYLQSVNPYYAAARITPAP